MTSLTSRIKALRDVCEGVIAASDRATKGPWKSFCEALFADVTGASFPIHGVANGAAQDCHFIALSRTLTPQFARATIKTLDWLEADLKEAIHTGLYQSHKENRIHTLLSEFGI